ncbi:MAG TPA: hypothetical protein VJM08_09290, partial [Anaerolineales bacterium]|nr:hypothetical protein [Anaerolineales bacterium]
MKREVITNESWTLSKYKRQKEKMMTHPKKMTYLLAIVSLVVGLTASMPALALTQAQASLDPNTQFYVP